MTTPVDADMLQRACDIANRIMSGVQPDQLGDPTPCSDWTVRDLMEHMVASTDFFADAAEHGSVAADRDWPGYSPEELLPAHRHHAGRLVAAFRDPGVIERPMVILAGPSTALQTTAPTARAFTAGRATLSCPHIWSCVGSNGAVYRACRVGG